MNKNQNQFLHRVRVALTNALSTPDILTALSEYSYDAKKIRQGLSLYDDIEELTRQREQAQEAQYQTTELLGQAKEELLYIFKIHVSTARLGYQREAAAQDTLRITRAAPRETVACLEHIKRFYAHVPTSMMAKYHVPQKELTQAGRLLDRVEELLALQKKMMSQPQQITEVRMQKLVELQTWMRRFDKISQVALDDQPQQREVLGQVVK